MLANYKAARREFPLAGEAVVLRGLTLPAVETLIQAHKEDLEALVGLFTNLDAIEQADLGKIGFAILSQAPGVAANIIALAADEPTAAPNIQREVAAPVQIEMLAVIGELTFMEVGGVKKFVEMLVGLIGGSGLRDVATKAGMTKSKTKTKLT